MPMLAPNPRTAQLQGQGAAGTPGSEKDVYYDADQASNEHAAHAGDQKGADVARKPSIATGGLESREAAGGGSLANKHDEYNARDGNSKFRQHEDVTETGMRDSGYAPGSDTKQKRNSVSFSPPQDQKERSPDARHGQAFRHDDTPTPPYAEHDNFYGSGDQKSPSAGNRKSVEGGAVGSAAGAEPASYSPRQQQSQGQYTQRDTKAQDQAALDRTTSPTQSEGDGRAAGAFANGAAVTGPDAIPDDNERQHQRQATAEDQLPDSTKQKIGKEELKDAKLLSKVIKAEGKSQKANVTAFLKELSNIQKVQKQASKDESKALSAHSKATARAHKLHTKFLAAKSTYDKAEADLNSKTEYLDMSRKYAQEKTAELSTKSRELEELRRAKAVDDREREAKLMQLSQQKK